ncbi:MAG: hypothetical protein Q8M57_01600 [Nitrosomonas sp.]|nr:hypothetical protein [Nitrosomonas sp.]MDP3279749.1 hypothetical protein [Nitrosomonas sp.]
MLLYLGTSPIKVTNSRLYLKQAVLPIVAIRAIVVKIPTPGIAAIFLQAT